MHCGITSLYGMICSDFRDRFSEYLDGTAEPDFLANADTHLAACSECRRYHDVLTRGSAILRGMPAVTVSEDFFPRLQHRIYHLEDASALAVTAGSGTTIAAALAIAMLIALAAWSPALVRLPQVALPPIVVNHPEPRLVGIQPPRLWMGVEPSPLWASAEPTPSSFVSAANRGLWDDPRVLVRYSPLNAGSMRQTRSVRLQVLISSTADPR